MSIQTSDPIFRKLADGSVEIIFKNPEASSNATSPIFHSLEITLVAFEEDIHLSSFNTNRLKNFVDKINSDFI